MEFKLAADLEKLYPNLSISQSGDKVRPTCRVDGNTCTPEKSIYRKIELDQNNQNIVTGYHLEIETLAGCSWCCRNS